MKILNKQKMSGKKFITYTRGDARNINFELNRIEEQRFNNEWSCCSSPPGY